jgi:hypothetical protein
MKGHSHKILKKKQNKNEHHFIHIKHTLIQKKKKKTHSHTFIQFKMFFFLKKHFKLSHPLDYLKCT